MTATALPYDDLVWACTNLCDLIEYENEVLARHDAATVAELADNKAALANIYERAVAPMADEPELVDTLEPEQKEELLALGNRLKDLVEENARLLKAQIDTRSMVIDTIVEAVKNNTKSTTVYSKEGIFPACASADGNSLSIDGTF